jgi:hypothetical protein
MESSLLSLASAAAEISNRNDNDPLDLFNDDLATFAIFGRVENFLNLLVKGEQLRFGGQYFVGGLLVRSIKILDTYRKGIKGVMAFETRKGSVTERDRVLEAQAKKVLEQLAILWGQNSIDTSPFREIEPSELYRRVPSKRKLSSNSVPPSFMKGENHS